MLLQNHSLTEVVVDNIVSGNALVGSGSENDEQNSINTLLNNNLDWKTYKVMPAVVTTDATRRKTQRESRFIC